MVNQIWSKFSVNIANNKDIKNSLKKVCTISHNFLPQGQVYNSQSKSYYCVNAVNLVKTILWQSNMSNFLNANIPNFVHIQKSSNEIFSYEHKSTVYVGGKLQRYTEMVLHWQVYEQPLSYCQATV